MRWRHDMPHSKKLAYGRQGSESFTMTPTRRAALAALGALALPRAAIAAPRPLRLTLLGQALIQHDLRREPWPDRAAITRRLRAADVVFTNLETVIRGDLTGDPTREALTLHTADAAVIDCLKSIGVGLVATANNHAFDLGTGGVLSTVGALNAAGLAFAGSGADLAQAAAPSFAADGQVALVAFATGKIRPGGAAGPDHPGVNEVREDRPGVLNETDLARVFDAVAAARTRGATVIAYHHNHLWGDDMEVTPDWQRALARRCVAAGASVYVSHGAPVLHGIEMLQGAPAFYGLGNFIFQTRTALGTYPARAWDSVIAACRFKQGRLSGLDLMPIRLNPESPRGSEDVAARGVPSLAQGADAARILKDIKARSAAFSARLELRDGGARLIL
jgi:poly-gamma-glutamate capsule biosynthesis protein CapA/YwtB (metallophosphatase superfamily)